MVIGTEDCDNSSATVPADSEVRVKNGTMLTGLGVTRSWLADIDDDDRILNGGLAVVLVDVKSGSSAEAELGL